MLEYQKYDGSIGRCFPDFIVKESETSIWIIETKSVEDLDVPLKSARLAAWCADAGRIDGMVQYRSMLIREELWRAQHAPSFHALCAVHAMHT